MKDKFKGLRNEPVEKIPLPISEATECSGQWLIYTSFLKVGKYWEYLNSLKLGEYSSKGVIIDGETKVYYTTYATYMLENHTPKQLETILKHRIKTARKAEKAAKERKKANAKPRKETKWTKHLKAYRSKHPGKNLTDCMKEAAKTYKATTTKKPTKPAKRKRSFGKDSDGFDF